MTAQPFLPPVGFGSGVWGHVAIALDPAHLFSTYLCVYLLDHIGEEDAKVTGDQAQIPSHTALEVIAVGALIAAALDYTTELVRVAGDKTSPGE